MALGLSNKICIPLLARALVLLAAIPASVAIAAPAVFSDLSFDEALEASKAQGRKLIVMGTAEWCGPCQMMKRDTWVDERVEAWVGEHAIAIMLDVDHARQDARRLEIRSMPTTILFDASGEEASRLSGYRDAEALLEWLETGEDPGFRGMGNPFTEIMESIERANELIAEGEHDIAAAELIELWDELRDAPHWLRSIRNDMLGGAMRDLAQIHEPSRDRFASLRDEVERALREGAASYEDLSEWVMLNGVVGQEERTIAWVERVRDRPDSRDAFDRLHQQVFSVLIGHDRWDLAGAVAPAAVETAQMHVMQRAMMEAQMREVYADDEDAWQTTMAQQDELLRRSVSDLYAACLAAGREQEASGIVGVALAAYDDAALRIALVSRALDAGEPRSEHELLLSQAKELLDADAPEELTLRWRETRERLERALAAGTGG